MKSSFLLAILLLFIFSSCYKDESSPYNQQFIHIMSNDASTATVNDKANSIGTYSVYFSTPQYLETMTVTYKIMAGAGLTAGVDYELTDTGNTLTFLPGIYDMPIRVRWKANAVDPGKDNTLTITLVSNDKGIPMGLPGPDGKQKSLVITKVP